MKIHYQREDGGAATGAPPRSDAGGGPYLIDSWAEVAAAIHFEALSAQRQQEAREEFFQIVIRPRLSAEQIPTARHRFEREVERYLAERAGSVPTPSGDLCRTHPRTA